MGDQDEPVWLRPHEVAARLGVNRVTVLRWGRKYRLATQRMPSGERRYREDQIREIERRRDAGEPITPFTD